MRKSINGTIVAAIVLLSMTSQAQEPTCLDEALAVASRILNVSKLAPNATHVSLITEYSDQDTEFVKKEKISFDLGQSGLVIVMLPNYYGNGICQFDSAQQWRD